MDGAVLQGKKYATSLKEIRAAADRIRPHIRRTPLLQLPPDPSTSDATALHLKLECLQRSGSFKFRGACNSVMALEDKVAQWGVVTHSSGNHAGALALAASLRGEGGIAANVIMPFSAPECKQRAVKAAGGRITLCEPTMEAREAAATIVTGETGAILIPPYNYGPVMAGQGTVGLEIMEQCPDIDCIVVPVSGAGLISGIALAVREMNPDVFIVAAEPEGEDGKGADIYESFFSGSIVHLPPPSTKADGLRAQLGDLTWPVVRDLVDTVIKVPEAAILPAMKEIWSTGKVIAEPSGAVPLAAYRSAAFEEWRKDKRIEKVALVVSGSNMDLQLDKLEEMV